jgi:hypothetical protein
MLNTGVHYGALLLLIWVVASALLVILYRRELWRLWREPVFRHPMLIIESDDWGAGPPSQVAALRDIAAVLSRHRDGSGRAPTFNLAIVLAVPDGPAMLAGVAYRRVCLDAPVFAPILSALRDGQASGVFALQLHGLEHYWPPTLMASDDAAVQAWLRQPAPATTEHLPSHLQSRWVDTAHLPSTPHANAAIRAAVAEEVHTYERVLGVPPRIVVPPTFVWTRETELAWADEGLECIVTPGRRYTGRNAQGLPDGAQAAVVNGDSDGKIMYVVRTDYFEPARGRGASHALRALDCASAMGRPCLLENHRDNFIGEPQTCRDSLAELDKLCSEALTRHADLRFVSTGELARMLRDRDLQWLVTRFAERLPFVWMRLRHAGRLWKLMVLTGMAAAASLVVWLLGRPPAKLPSASNA